MVFGHMAQVVEGDAIVLDWVSNDQDQGVNFTLGERLLVAMDHQLFPMVRNMADNSIGC